MRDMRFRVKVGDDLVVVCAQSDYTITFGNDRPILNVFSQSGEHVDSFEVDVVDQHTGLKDSEGVDIYEGDIVGFGDDSPSCSLGMYGELGKVVYCPFSCSFKVSLCESNRRVSLSDIPKVFGNIHKTPELLND